MTTFELNGRTVSVQSSDDTPLLWVIRDELGLTGTKFGCGIGFCGACTVHVEGRATRSCITLVGAVAEAKITTKASIRRASIPCKPHGSSCRFPSADIASRDRSCRRRHYSIQGDLDGRFGCKTHAGLHQKTHGRISGPAGAATKLRIPDSTLETKIQRLGIDKYRFKSKVR
jgi:hypothetical protein